MKLGKINPGVFIYFMLFFAIEWAGGIYFYKFNSFLYLIAEEKVTTALILIFLIYTVSYILARIFLKKDESKITLIIFLIIVIISACFDMYSLYTAENKIGVESIFEVVFAGTYKGILQMISMVTAISR